MNFKVYFTKVEKVLFAFIFGTVIGIENAFRSKTARFRLLILICVGSSLYALLSKNVSEINPDVIVCNIVTIIGFIGAGVVFKEKIFINGLTTNALISLTAALGIAKENGDAIDIYRISTPDKNYRLIEEHLIRHRDVISFDI